jgi:glycosyltransferase involved in cell wall biosynthesis
MGKVPFSVIVTTFNRKGLLLRAIDSILQQTFSGFELIIVDDASTDNTAEVVASINDSRIRYLCQPRNLGVSAARNRGIQVAKGEYIVFVDDDDTISPSFLAEVHRALLHAPTTVGFLWTWREMVRQTESGVEKLRVVTFDHNSSEPQPGTNLLNKPVGGSGGLIVRASALDAVGSFDPELRVSEDTELLIRLAKQYDYIVLTQPLYQAYTAHGERLTKPSLLRAQTYEHIIETHQAWLPQYPGILTVMYKGAARMYYQIGERRKARGAIWQLIRYQPTNWRNWILFLLLELLPILPPSLARRALAG